MEDKGDAAEAWRSLGESGSAVLRTSLFVSSMSLCGAAGVVWAWGGGSSERQREGALEHYSVLMATG